MAKQTEQLDVIDWLMQGDPSIRWQTMRDLLDKPATQWKREQAKVATEGWGKQLLDLRDPAGTWGGGIYTPKWTSTNYTLLLLRDMGLPRNTAVCTAGAKLLLESLPTEGFERRLRSLDDCILGMYLSLGAYFGVNDPRLCALVEQALRSSMPDGGWNCACRLRKVHHSSLHTTINVLDGLADYAQYGGKKATALVAPAIERAHEFLFEHRLFRSDKTGEVIRTEFTEFSFPPRWHWDVLRGLDHLRRMDVPRDKRLGDAIDLLLSKRCPDGLWRLENHHKRLEFFTLERQGRPSRWNTLRALRVLRWWKGSSPKEGT